MENINLYLWWMPVFLFILGIVEIIFARKIAKFYSRTAKYDKRPTVKPMPSSYYTPKLVRGIGIGMIIFSLLIMFVIFIGAN